MNTTDLPKLPTPAVLRRAAELVRRGWTRNTEARNAADQEVEVASPDAAKFCAIGAIRRAAFDLVAPEIGEDRARLKVDTVARPCVDAFAACVAPETVEEEDEDGYTYETEHVPEDEDIFNFNDHSASSAEEVALALEECADANDPEKVTAP